jgi:hypothetical protein
VTPLARSIRLGALPLCAAVAACSVGQGSGSVVGSYHDEICMVDRPEFSLAPSYFAADVIEDPGDADGQIRRQQTMRIQRGSGREADSDGLSVYVRDVNRIERELLGTPIPLVENGLVELTLYLNQTCDAGFPSEHWQIPGILAAVSGEIVFDAVYAPDVDPSPQITARFDDVLFADPEWPERRFARMSGEFTFFYQRGRPAQRFP